MALLESRNVVYCGECGMPPEYCEYGPDYESHCKTWLLKNHPQLCVKLFKKDCDNNGDGKAIAVVKPTEPWTTEERLVQFYEKYQPDKVGDVSKILEKYAGKEDKLFAAMVKKYGPEPEDPFYDDSDDDDDDDDDNAKVEETLQDMSLKDDSKKKKKKKKRGAAAKKLDSIETRIVIQKVLRNKRKSVTIIMGMDTIPDLKLKEASKSFSKRFAGSSTVKDTPQGKKEIIIQGDHMDDVAAMIVNKFKVPAGSVFLDINGEFVPFQA